MFLTLLLCIFNPIPLIRLTRTVTDNCPIWVNIFRNTLKLVRQFVAYTQVLKVVKKPLSGACIPVHRNIGHSRLIGRLFFYIGSDISDRRIGFFLVSAHPYLRPLQIKGHVHIHVATTWQPYLPYNHIFHDFFSTFYVNEPGGKYQYIINLCKLPEYEGNIAIRQQELKPSGQTYVVGYYTNARVFGGSKYIIIYCCNRRINFVCNS